MRHWLRRYREESRGRRRVTILQQQYQNQNQQHQQHKILRESPIQPDRNPKGRLLMNSASSTTSGSGQQRSRWPATETESVLQTRDPLGMGTGESTTLTGAQSANTRRRIVVKSEPVAVTTQEAVDGCREKQ